MMIWVIVILLVNQISITLSFDLTCNSIFGVTRTACFAKRQFCNKKGVPLDWSPSCSAVNNGQEVLGDCVCAGSCSHQCEEPCRREEGCVWDKIEGCKVIGGDGVAMKARRLAGESCPVRLSATQIAETVTAAPTFSNNGEGDAPLPVPSLKCNPNPTNGEGASYCPDFLQVTNPSCAEPSEKNPLGCICVGNGVCVKEVHIEYDDGNNIHLCCKDDDDECWKAYGEFPMQPRGALPCGVGSVCLPSCLSEIGAATCRQLCELD